MVLNGLTEELEDRVDEIVLREDLHDLIEESISDGFGYRGNRLCSGLSKGLDERHGAVVG